MPEFSASQLINPDFNSDFNQAALQGVQRQKEVGGLNALQGVNLSDPQSVSNAVGNSIKSGNLDQATALMGVNIANTVNTKILPGYLARLQGQQPGQQQTQPQTSQTQAQPQAQAPDPQHMADTMSMAKQAVDSLLQTPEDQRPQAFEQIKAQMQARGVPDAAIDSAIASKDGSGQDLSDANLKGLSDFYGAHADHFTAHAQGQTPDASQLPTQQGVPWYKSVSEDPYLNDPMMQGILKKYLGIDVEPQLSRAAQLAMPAITEAAKTAAIGAQTKEKESNEFPFEVAKKAIDNHFATSKEPVTLYPPGSQQGQTVSNAQWQAHPDVYAGWSTAPSDFAKAQGTSAGTIAGEVGPGKNLVDKENMLQEQTNLTEASKAASGRLQSTQYADSILNDKQLLNLASSISTGPWTKDLSSIAQKLAPGLPQSRLAEYAANTALYNQDLSKAAREEFKGFGSLRISNEANKIIGAIPQDTSPQDTGKIFAMLKLAKDNMAQDSDRHLTQYQQNPTNGRSLTAAGNEFDNHRPDILAYALPELQKMTIGGKPAVEVRQFPDPDNKGKFIYKGMFLPGSKNSVQFYIGRTK